MIPVLILIKKARVIDNAESKKNFGFFSQT